MKRKLPLFIIFFLLVGIIVVFLFNTKNPTSNGIEWNGKQDISVQSEVKRIAIPGFNEMVFASQQKNQKVNLYNPSENTCTMTFEMFMEDGTLLWHEENIQPGYGFYNIDINKILESGTYENCTLIVHCFDHNNIELNGGVIKFTLYVK